MKRLLELISLIIACQCTLTASFVFPRNSGFTSPHESSQEGSSIGAISEYRISFSYIHLKCSAVKPLTSNIMFVYNICGIHLLENVDPFPKICVKEEKSNSLQSCQFPFTISGTTYTSCTDYAVSNLNLFRS